MGNTAPNSAHELCNTRCFVLPFACEATSGYGFGTRPVLKGSAKNEKQLEAIDPKAAPDGGSGWIGFGRLRDLTIGKVADQVVGDRKQVGFLQGNRDALEDRAKIRWRVVMASFSFSMRFRSSVRSRSICCGEGVLGWWVRQAGSAETLTTCPRFPPSMTMASDILSHGFWFAGSLVVAPFGLGFPISNSTN